MFIHLHIVYVCLFATWQSWVVTMETVMAHSTKTFSIWPCTGQVSDPVVSDFSHPSSHCVMQTMLYVSPWPILLVPGFFLQQLHDSLTLQKIHNSFF